MLLNISQHSSLTLQEQIIGQIRARILNGDLAPETPLPSIRALSQQLRVGINTVQRAYDELLREELIYARAGKGFFVAPLEEHDKSSYAKERFAAALHGLITDAQQEGLSRKDLKQTFTQILKEIDAAEGQQREMQNAVT
jgi:GntR family transcriptional regulator